MRRNELHTGELLAELNGLTVAAINTAAGLCHVTLAARAVSGNGTVPKYSRRGLYQFAALP